MGSDCSNIGLLLALGGTPLRSPDDVKKKLVLKFDDKLPSLSLGPSGLSESADVLYQQGSSASAVSSFSNSSSFKRGRDGEEKEAETEVYLERAVSTKACEEDDDGSPRKKLRLTKEQSAILEDSFKEHASLSPKQKRELARQLNLKLRQVEVWFQNRRARTKLKQTEMDCELLKKYCEKLKEDNTKLHKELEELKSLKLMVQPFRMQLQAATLTVCPSCDTSICVGGGGGGDGPPAATFSNGPKPHFLKYPFNPPSAAC